MVVVYRILNKIASLLFVLSFTSHSATVVKIDALFEAIDPIAGQSQVLVFTGDPGMREKNTMLTNIVNLPSRNS